MAIRVAVAGLGVRGRDWVREIENDDAFTLAACSDPDPAARARMPRAFATLDDALASAECDAVVVASSADAHEEPCETAIAHGKAVLVEKPFTTSLASATRLVQLAEERSVPLLVAQNYRYLRVWRAVREVIAHDRLGNVTRAVAHYYRPPHEMAPSLARAEHRILWGVAVHHLDALRHALGQRVSGVRADLTRDSLDALLTFENGARATYTATYESSAHEFFERGQEFYARFTGDRATLHVIHRWLFLCEGRKLPRIVRRGPRLISEERVLLGELARAIRGAPSALSGRENLDTMAVVEACVRSSEEKRVVDPRELLD